MPIEIINPAMPAADKVTGKSLKNANIIVINILRDKTAINPGKRYQRIKKRAINKNPIMAALTPALTAVSPKVAPIVWVEIRLIGTGKAPEFNLPTNNFASLGLKLPEMTA